MDESLPLPPKYWNAELEAKVTRRGGLFLLGTEGRESEFGKMMEVIVSRINNHVNFSQSQLYSEKPRALEWGFTSDSGFNAFAYASENQENPEFDFVGINIGSLYTFITIFNRILSHPDTFLDIGNPEKESRERSYVPYLTQDATKSGFLITLPVCPIRCYFAFELSKIAMDFIFFHEVTHLRNGHIEFFRKNLLDIDGLEVPDGYTRSSNAIQQVLEVDADCGGILLTLNHLYDLRDNYLTIQSEEKGDFNKIEGIIYEFPYSVVRMLRFTLHVIFRLSDFSEWLYYCQENFKHHYDPLRSTYFGPTVIEIFKTRNGYDYDPDKFARDDVKFVEEAEIACGLIQNDGPPDFRGLLSVLENRSLMYQYFDDFKSTWAEIRPALEKYKRGGILP